MVNSNKETVPPRTVRSSETFPEFLRREFCRTRCIMLRHFTEAYLVVAVSKSGRKKSATRSIHDPLLWNFVASCRRILLVFSPQYFELSKSLQKSMYHDIEFCLYRIISLNYARNTANLLILQTKPIVNKSESL